MFYKKEEMFVYFELYMYNLQNELKYTVLNICEVRNMKKIISIILGIVVIILVGCVKKQPIEMLNPPKNLMFSDNTLTFDEVLNATSYVIEVDGINIEISTNSYTFEEEGIYLVRVYAKGENYLDSSYSNQIEIKVVNEKNDLISSPKNLRFINNTLTFDSVEGASSYSIHGLDEIITVLTNSYTFTESGIFYITVIANSINNEKSLKSNELEIIVVFENSDPFVIKRFNEKSDLLSDTSFTFEMAGANFDSLIGRNITPEDYYFDNNKLTIKVNYLKNEFEKHPDSPIILTYSFIKENKNHFGFVTITKQ